MPRKSKDEAEKTRKRILASALTLFVAKGYERTTFTDIAAKLKMTKGAVYWHFESKERLLMALVEEMLSRFEEQTTALMPKDELTVEAVSRMMVENARALVSTPRFRDFFVLMHSQIRWGEATMDGIRENMLKNTQFGPWHAFHRAAENERKAGRVRSDVEPEEVACLYMSLWDGVVQAVINGFVNKEKMNGILERGFAAIGQSIVSV